jgi:hypothetical protein
VRIITTESPVDDVGRYIRRWANRAFVEERLAAAHTGVAAEKRRKKAADVSASITQGLELLNLAGAATLLTKPLPLFYAAEAFAKALAIVRLSEVDGDTFAHNGLIGEKHRRYYIRTLTCKVGRHPRGVWPHLAACGNGEWIVFRGVVDGVDAMRTSRQGLPAPPPIRGTQLELRELVRHLPELGEDVGLAGWGSSYSILAGFPRFNSTTTDPPRVSVSARLRHGHDPGNRTVIQRAARAALIDFQLLPEVLDVQDVRVDERDGWPRLPAMRMSIFGEQYWDLAPSSLASELLIYYASLFIIADVVRYQGQWRRLIDDHPEEAILVDRFLDLAIRKVPNLTLNELADDLYLFKAAPRFDL